MGRQYAPEVAPLGPDILDRALVGIEGIDHRPGSINSFVFLVSSNSSKGARERRGALNELR